MQIQRVKNALLAPFLLSDEVGEANDTLNEFTLVIKELVEEFVGFFIIENEFGNTLTQHGKDIKTFAVDAIKVAVELIRELKDIFLESNSGLKVFTNLLYMATIPMKVLLKVLSILGPRSIELLIWFKVMNALLPINTAFMWLQTRAHNAHLAGMIAENAVKPTSIALSEANTIAKGTETVALQVNALSWTAVAMAMTLGVAAVVLVIAGVMSMSDPLKALTLVALGLAAAFGAMWVAGSLGTAAAPILAGLAAVSVGIAAVGGVAMGVRSTGMPEPTIPSISGNLGTGMPFIAGGAAGAAANMMPSMGVSGGMGGGPINITINGNVYDGENFAESVAEVLPNAFRNLADTSGDIIGTGRL
tara:strand:+ start:1 stop:1083 length:1083 start_codon:yes stop_codon:yes gene_type:complete